MSLAYTLFDTLLEPVFVLNAEQKVVYCNETAAIVSDLTVRKITRGMLFESIFHFAEPLEFLKNLNTTTEPTPYKELSFTTLSGEKGKIQITLQPLPQAANEEPLWILFVRDVTLEERLQLKYRAELEQKENVIKDLETAKEQLEDYSKNLEKKVIERTKEISSLNQKMSALLDSLGQGFFIFDKKGLCLEVNSKACEETIESLPAGRMIWDVLKLPPAKMDGFKKWMITLFSEMLPFADLAPLGPNVFPHSEGKNIALEYFPLRAENGGMDGVVVVASDITTLVAAKKQAETEKENAKLIINLVKSKKEIARFIRDSESLLADLEQEMKNTAPDEEFIYRYLHTLKGGASSFSVQAMAEACHEAENQLNVFKQTRAFADLRQLREESVKIRERFDDFLAEAKEILGAKQLGPDRQIEVSYSKIRSIVDHLQSTPAGKPFAQLLLSELIMEPIGSFFEPYVELTARLAHKEGKLVFPVVLHGKDIPVLPEVYSNLFATFVHAFRNAVDHGIEFPSAREAAGKPSAGRIEVYFEWQPADANLKIRIQDDGQGVDPVRIRATLKKKNIPFNHESDEQVIQHLFDSQFSTREVVTETSGRGVGMDAIRSSALALGGSVWVQSQKGFGTELIITVPYFQNVPEKIKKAA